MAEGEQPAHSFILWEPPDIVFMAFIGDIFESEMRWLTTESTLLGNANPDPFVLVDLSRIGSVSPEARVVAKFAGKGARVRATAVFGASFHHRVIATLVNRAARMLNGGSHHPIEFFATEAEARAWIAQRRGQAQG